MASAAQGIRVPVRQQTYMPQNEGRAGKESCAPAANTPKPPGLEDAESMGRGLLGYDCRRVCRVVLLMVVLVLVG